MTKFGFSKLNGYGDSIRLSSTDSEVVNFAVSQVKTKFPKAKIETISFEDEFLFFMKTFQGKVEFW